MQRLLRQGTNPVSVRRAEILLEAGLGASVEQLAKRYSIPESYLEHLISESNAHGSGYSRNAEEADSNGS